jgi:hypothetical protein
MKVLILRLSNSRDTAASSTHQVLAELSRIACPEALIDFAFLPSKRSPAVVGVQSGLAWSEFDVILVSNSFVQETINLPWLLSASGLSPWAYERPESFPPIILGGSNAFASQSLVCPDGRAVPDVLFFGEAEEMLPVFLKRFGEECWNTGIVEYTETVEQSLGGTSVCSSEARRRVPLPETVFDSTRHSAIPSFHYSAVALSKRSRLLSAAEGLDGFWVTGELPIEPVRQAVVRDAFASSLGSGFSVQTLNSQRLTLNAQIKKINIQFVSGTPGDDLATV